MSGIELIAAKILESTVAAADQEMDDLADMMTTDTGDLLMYSEMTALVKNAAGVSGRFKLNYSVTDTSIATLKSMIAQYTGGMSNIIAASNYSNISEVDARALYEFAPPEPGSPPNDLSAFTWNPADKHANVFVQNSDLRARVNYGVGGATRKGAVRATGSISAGKGYWEIFAQGFQAGQSDAHVIGVMDSGHSLIVPVGTAATGWAFDELGPVNFEAGKWNNGEVTAGAPNWGGSGTQTYIMVAVDITAGKIWWGVNGVWHSSGDPAAGTNPMFSNVIGTLFPAVYLTASFGTSSNGTSIADVNFGASAWQYTPPNGFAP